MALAGMTRTSLGLPALQHLAATLRVLAFALFTVHYWPVLNSRRQA